jgi:hypothetical protein
MIKELIKKRSLESYRLTDNENAPRPLQNHYWKIAFDGTGISTFTKRHCEHCLTKEFKDQKTGEVIKTIYYHVVLEAKIIVGDMVLSIGTEFIENEKANVSKQDCEINAFKRLAEKIKKNFPKLRICLLADSLYAGKPIFDICEMHGWKYLIRFKEGKIPSIMKEYLDKDEQKKLESLSLKNIKDSKFENDYNWGNGIVYQNHEVNLVEMATDVIEIYEKEMEKKEAGQSYDLEKATRIFVFITNIKLTSENIYRVVMGGQSRWKIENAGFNYQKNDRYHIEHQNSWNYNAQKNHYLMVQITDILMQLHEKAAVLFKKIKKTIKEKSSVLLEAIRTRKITEEDLVYIAKPIQIRLG